MEQAARSEGVNRFSLEPRPPSPPPAFLRLPWWQRWLVTYVVVGALFAVWVQALFDGRDRTLVGWIAAPYFATPMVVLAVLLVRSRRRRTSADGPQAFAWGATLSLVSIFLFTLGYAAWPLMVATTPAALTFLVYALTQPARGRRFVAALTSLVVVVIGFAELSALEEAAAWVAVVGGVAHLAWLGRGGR